MELIFCRNNFANLSYSKISQNQFSRILRPKNSQKNILRIFNSAKINPCIKLIPKFYLDKATLKIKWLTVIWVVHDTSMVGPVWKSPHFIREREYATNSVFLEIGFALDLIGSGETYFDSNLYETKRRMDDVFEKLCYHELAGMIIG